MSTKNAPDVKYPFGLMIPPTVLQQAVTGLRTAEEKLIVSRDAMKAKMASFHNTFFKKYPKAGLADFARQFDKTVPTKREGYTVHACYMALQNMFRYMPEVTGKAKQSPADKAATIAKAKKARKAKLRAADANRNKAQRLLMAIVQQIGIPNSLFTIAAQRCGFAASEIESLWNLKDSLVDVGLGTCILAIKSGKNAGMPIAKVMAQDKVKDKAVIAAVPTAAELANQAKGKPTVKDTPAPVYKGKGQYSRVVIVKAGDSVKANGHATS